MTTDIVITGENDTIIQSNNFGKDRVVPDDGLM
jgi:hypothetical protein